MNKVNKRTRLVTGSPIEVGQRRLLPSVLVTTVKKESAGVTIRGTNLRPSSFVEQGPEGNRWHNIPNSTQDQLSRLAALGLGAALLSTLIILMVKINRW